MSTRASKKRKLNRNDLSTGHPPAFPGDPAEEATDEDRKKWNGWCEIESEPVSRSKPSYDALILLT